MEKTYKVDLTEKQVMRQTVLYDKQPEPVLPFSKFGGRYG